jgi:squamous cell carcinoma antigen recognized by T-cells 3
MINLQFMNLESPLSDQAVALWQTTAKHYKSSFLAWSKYSELLMYGLRLHHCPLLTFSSARREYMRARALLKDVSYKAIDWPEAIWQLWAEFEYLHGSVEDLEHCLEKVNLLSAKLEKKRAQVFSLISNI